MISYTEEAVFFEGVGSIPLKPPSEELRPFMERKFRTLFRHFCLKLLVQNVTGITGNTDMEISFQAWKQVHVVCREGFMKNVCGMFDQHPQEEKERLNEKYVDDVYGKVVLFGRDSINENEYTEKLVKKIYSDTKTRRDWIETLLPLMKMSFDNIDKVQDDVIEHDEFAAWFSNHGVNSITIKNLFGILDINGDGLISLEEFMFGFTNYYMCSGPESPLSLWFGPIIET